MKTTRQLRLIISLLLLFCLTKGCEPQHPTNEVDLIKSEDDVRAFLRKHGSKRFSTYDPFQIRECDKIRTLTTPFFKVDIDKNGQTDLIVNGRGLIIVAMQQSTGSYEIWVMPNESGELYGCELDSIGDTDSLCFIYVSHRFNPCNEVVDSTNVLPVAGRDTLIGFEGRLLKYRPHKSSKRISKICLRSLSCLSSYPTYSFEVDTLGAVMYYPGGSAYQSDKIHVTLGSDSSSRIFRLAERLRPEQMDSVYMNSIDLPHVRFSFFFEDGTVKHVMTDGIREPGLESLWRLLDDVRYSNGWDLTRAH